MSLKPVQTKKAPEAIGPYSQAIECGSFIFTSGQIAINPETGMMVGETIEEQTYQVLKNLLEILKECGATFYDVVDTTIFCTDLNDFGAINKVYSEMMGDHRPARSTVQVASLPKNAKIEIKMTAFVQE
ncbi:MAG: RidA family protein [Spirochaetales bacterium]|nr:RidA family protein [Spirochaetales bacterium]